MNSLYLALVSNGDRPYFRRIQVDLGQFKSYPIMKLVPFNRLGLIKPINRSRIRQTVSNHVQAIFAFGFGHNLDALSIYELVRACDLA